MASKLKKKNQRSQVFDKKDWDKGAQSEYVQQYIQRDISAKDISLPKKKEKPEIGEFGLGPDGEYFEGRIHRILQWLTFQGKLFTERLTRFRRERRIKSKRSVFEKKTLVSVRNSFKLR